MKIGKILFMLLFLCQIASAQTDNNRDYVFLIDCSGSMSGLPKGSGNIDIFPKVKAAVKNYIGSISEGNNVIIFPFHQGIQDTIPIQLNSKNDYELANTKVDNLKATGNFTYIYSSILDVFNYLRTHNNNKDRIQSILVYTDGKDNSPNNITFDRIVNEFNLLKDENNGFLYMTYISLNVQPPDIKNLPKGITIKREPPDTVTEYYLIEVHPSHLYFRDLKNQEPVTRQISLNYDIQNISYRNLKLNLKADFPELGQLGIIVDASPKQFDITNRPQDIRITLSNLDYSRIDKDVYEGKLEFSSQSENLQIRPSFIPVTLLLKPAIVKIIPDKLTNINFDQGELALINDTFYNETSFRINFNKAAIDKNLSLKLDIDQQADNPTIINLGKNYAYSFEGKENRSLVIPAVDSILTVKLVSHLPKDISPGKYNFKVHITSSYNFTDLIIKHSDVQIDTLNKTGDINSSFSIPKIIPWYVYFLIIFSILLIVSIIYCFLLTPKFHPGWSIKSLQDGTEYQLKKYGKFCGMPSKIGGLKSDFKFMELDRSIFLLKPVSKQDVVLKVLSDLKVNGMEQKKNTKIMLDRDSKNEVESGNNKYTVWKEA